MHGDAGPSIDGTRLPAERYFAAWESDLTAMARASAGNLDRGVPGCPGWNVRDLLSHVIGVYRHKCAVLDGGGPPEDPAEGGWGVLGPADDPVDALLAAYGDLRARLSDLPLAATAWTWWPPEQTAGFWVRRMAHETAVHRWDAESAVRGVADADPIDADLAADGVDELLGWLRWEWPAELALGGAGEQRVRVISGSHAWIVTVDPQRFGVIGGEADCAADATVEGEASTLVLHLWGRPVNGVRVAGNTDAVRLMLERLRASTD